MKPAIPIPEAKLHELCRRYRVRRLSFFGSVLQEDLGPQSDIDLPVEFEPDAEVGFLILSRMARELSALLSRPVDLVLRDGLKQMSESFFCIDARSKMCMEVTMSTKTTPLERFQSLLHELFQFDCADSNLGISCIMNHTQTVIEHFTTQDLFQAVAKELNVAQKLTDGADRVFVNGDSLIPSAQWLDPVFKECMFSGMEVF